MLIISSERFADHITPPGHPESPERNNVLETVAARLEDRGAEVVEPRPATREQVLRVHAATHVDAIEATRGHASMLDADTYTSPDTADVVLLAAGAAVQAVEAVLDGSARGGGRARPSARAIMPSRIAQWVSASTTTPPSRPPTRVRRGCHGWPLSTTTSITATARRRSSTPTRRCSTCPCTSIPYYPGTGAATETGAGDGTGFTVNVPLEAGATDGDYLEAFDVRPSGPC